ncbi:MAG: HAD-IIIC family phosphatase [Verrucomicrobiaceae bacterium]|nr:HAD-IIIC family phosphatase [Verrucomicrobiaceae bacterium]
MSGSFHPHGVAKPSHIFFSTLTECVVRPAVTALLLVWICRRLPWPGEDALAWIAGAPLLYLAWYVLHLLLCVADTTCLRLVGAEKPRRIVMTDGGRMDARTALGMFLTLQMYGRYAFLHALPLSQNISRCPGLRWLLFRAYATRLPFHSSAMTAPAITDPELTRIDAGVILGDASRIVAHNLTRTRDGGVLFLTAPIHFQECCVIGGSTLIEMGVTVGARAVVEAASHVVAFTQIPPDEVWGGNPAVFVRHRDDSVAHKTAVAPPATEEDALSLVERALGLAAGKVSASSCSKDFPEWDSLGMMALAAAIHSRFGIALPPQEVFRLNSVTAVRQAVMRVPSSPAPRAAAAETVGDPELLPLLDPAEATARLASSPAAGSTRASVTVAVAATFVAQPLADALRLWARAFGIDASVVFADFNQVPQTLLTPGSLFDQNKTGFNVVLTRPEDLPGGKTEAEGILAALRTFAARSTAALLVADLPPALFFDRPSQESDALRLWWREQLAAIPGVQIVEFASIIAELGAAASRDEAMAGEASTPFSPVVYQRLGIALARQVRAACVPAKKVIAVDADGTLWRGIVGEDGVDALTVDAPFRSLQEKLATLRARGVLLALVSKNAEEDVWRALAENPAMMLKREDFAVARVNWLPKSENLRAIASELNLGLDAFVFVDDNPAERLEVAAHCPSVSVLKVDPAQFATALDKLWLFDGAGATREDAARASFQQQDAAREAARDPSGDLQSYLQSLDLVVQIQRATDDDLPRVSQLALKTNQFNTSLKRHTLPELRALSTTQEIWCVSARDKFGDYGLIGGVVGAAASGGYVVDSLFLSCRALGRGVEDALLHTLARHAKGQGACILRVNFIPGPRNEPARGFLTRAGFVEKADGFHELSLDDPPSAPGHLRIIS